MKISIVVPTLNEELALPRTLAALCALCGEREIIVADGGSSDGTKAIAEGFGVQFLETSAGRGAQMRAAADLASGKAIWFVHADTVAPAGALGAIEAALGDPLVAGGNFGLLFDGNTPGARRLTSIYPLLRHIGLAYGDSGIFVRSTVYRQVGGMRPIPLFEDLDLVRRISGAGRFIHLPLVLTTSSRRFEHRSFAGMWAKWTALQVAWWLGVCPFVLARFYTGKSASLDRGSGTAVADGARNALSAAPSPEGKPRSPSSS